MVGRKSERIRQQKRQLAQNGKPSAKRKNDNGAAEPNESPDQLKIIDLNNDCLEHIFKYLSLVELLNVADARKSLKDGIDQAFTSKYGKRKVKFNIKIYEPDEELLRKVNENDEEIEIVEFVTGLKFLRSFGKLTSTLTMVYNDLQQNQRLEMDNYLSGYCTETLNELIFLDVPKGAIAGVNEPFIKVNKLWIHHGELGRKLSDFGRWFPNMQHFTLDSILSTNGKCIEVHLPKLKHFEIKSAVEAKNIANCLRLNPHVQTLRVSNDDNLQIVLEAASELRQLEELYIRSFEDAIVTTEEVVHFKSVKKFELNYYLGRRPLPKIPLSFERLEECSIKVQDLPSSDLIKLFIAEHQSVKKIAITFDSSKIADDFDSIEELMEMESMRTWSFGQGWHSSIKRVGNYYCCMEFERNS